MVLFLRYANVEYQCNKVRETDWGRKTMYNILICDDEKDIVNALKIYLTNDNYKLFEAYDGLEALDVIENEEIDIVLLDIMMPRLDGISVLAKVREKYNMPVILLTAKSEDTDKILGLNVGADDYITKPFNPLEVAARVNSQLRRFKKFGASVDTPSVLGVGGIEMDDESKSVTVDGKPVTLTPKEYDILKLFLKSPNKVFSPKEIYRSVWNEDPMYGNDNTVAVHIRHLREKIEINSNEPRYIKVVFGQGYILEKGRN